MEILVTMSLTSLILGVDIKGVCSYQLFANSKKKFADAKIVCENNGQQLALIKSQADYTDVKVYLNSLSVSLSDMFIGLTWDANQHQFKWLDSEIMSWTRWDPNYGEPNCMSNRNPESFCQSNSEDCVRMTANFRFKTTKCTYKNYFLCGPVTPSTTATSKITSESTIPTATSTITSESTIPKVSTTITALTTQTVTTKLTDTSVSYESTETTKYIPTSTSKVASMSTTPTSTVSAQKTPTTALSTTRSITSESIAATSLTMSIAEILTAQPSFEVSNTTIGLFIATSTEFDHPVTTLKPVSSSNGLETCMVSKGFYCLCPEITVSKNKWTKLNNMNLTFAELTAIVVEDFERNIKPNISVDIKTLSKTIRRKTSAPDDRTSSSSLGWLSVVLISIPVCLFVSLDFSNLLNRRNREIITV